MRNRIVDGFAEYKAQHRACDKSGGQVRGQIMMNEQLSVHQEEWEVVDGPNNEEESSVIPQAVANSCNIIQLIPISLEDGDGARTIRDGIHGTTTSQQVGADDSNVDGKPDDTYPPADDVAG